jgi:hypothetical protein
VALGHRGTMTLLCRAFCANTPGITHSKSECCSGTPALRDAGGS